MSGPVPNPISDGDVSAVIGLLAVVEGELLGEQLDPKLVRSIRDRFVMAGLLAQDAETADLRVVVVAEMNQRFRYARGEYDEPPAPEGPVSHTLSAPDERTAAECFAAAHALWSGAGRVDAPDGDRQAWWVYVEDDAWPLTARFAQHQSALEDLARRLGVRYLGWQGNAERQADRP
jgi:hypothetical protein